MEVSVSILSSDKRLEYVNCLNHTNCSYIHVDVMDGKFVKDKQFSYNEIRAINYVSNKKLDVHLMVKNPWIYINNLRGYNIEYITFHLESGKDVTKTVNKIHKLGYKAGLAISPGTDIKEIDNYLSFIDMVLIMSVEPGYGGQKFLNSTIYRVNYVKEQLEKKDCKVLVEVDGGINDETVGLLSNVDIAVVGSYILKNGNNYFDYRRIIDGIISSI